LILYSAERGPKVDPRNLSRRKGGMTKDLLERAFHELPALKPEGGILRVGRMTGEKPTSPMNDIYSRGKQTSRSTGRVRGGGIRGSIDFSSTKTPASFKKRVGF
jgi:hypothetical protein